MGTETYAPLPIAIVLYAAVVKLNNPLMGTETEIIDSIYKPVNHDKLN